MSATKTKKSKKTKPPKGSDGTGTTLVRAWTWKYEPFQLGGMGGKPCQRPVAADLRCSGPYDLGKGFQGFLATAPNGRTVVIEKESGGIVGDTVEMVRDDIASCEDAGMMQEQVQTNKGWLQMAELLSAAAFWKLYCRAK